MIWVVLLIIALVAYFIFQGLRARHISRCHTDNRTAEHVPESIIAYDAHTEFHEQSAATAEHVQNERVPSAQSTPSLLYADRNSAARNQVRNNNQISNQHHQQNNEVATQNTSQPTTGNTQCTVDDVIDMDLERTPDTDYSLDSTAEHVPMGDVGTPADNRGYDSNAGIVAGGAAVAAGIAAAAPRHTDVGYEDVGYEDEYSTPQSEIESSSSTNAGTTENIDLELGESDNTFNDEDIEGDNHDELLDFGDLTADISDMLKELNLRETDSPRLEINKAEYEQLKTGEPGEVKPAKIENVADKLRNMLQ